MITSDKLRQLFRLIEREPNDTFLLYGVGMEYKKLSAYAQAIEYFDRVISIDPGYCYAYFQKGQVCELMSKPEQARRAYQDGIAAAKRVGDSHAQGELEAAMEAL